MVGCVVRKWEHKEKEGRLLGALIREDIEMRMLWGGQINISISILDIIRLRCN